MLVFISWSGERSYRIAVKLKEWLPLVLQGAEPWLSSEDIRKGSLWQAEIIEILRQSAAGIFCLTREAMSSPWVAFEAGAITAAAGENKKYICTYLVDGRRAEARRPLAMFQGSVANREDTLRMLRHLNKAMVPPMPEERLEKLFATFWPELEQVIASVRRASSRPTAARRPAARSSRLP
jgi:hypothetical protein